MVLAITYSNLPTAWLRNVAVAVFVLGTLGGFCVFNRRAASVILLGAFCATVVWFLLIPPSNDRLWQPDVALLPFADVGPQEVVLHNIRNCDYRSETDYTVHYYDKTFDLNHLRSSDLYVVQWGSPVIAHTMLSFQFDNGDTVCFSIEARKEKGEAYSAIQGFFRKFELIYIVGDERDLVRLRTNYRGETVRLYHLNAEPSLVRLVFLDYLRAINRTHDQPEWYNAATSNCTTNIRGHMKPYIHNTHFDWRILFNGRIDEMAYERKALDQSLPFTELRNVSLINDRARAADNDPAFSARIREGLPGFARTN
jgi:hypothetical protein